MDESVVEGGHKMDNTEGVDILGVGCLGWSEIGLLLLLDGVFLLLGWL